MRQLILWLLLATPAHATSFRITTLFHPHIKLGQTGLEVRADLIPNAPLAILELGGLGSKELEVAPALGWDFQTNGPVISLRLSPRHGKFWGWVDFELEPKSWGLYWLIQVQYTISPWLHVGFEEESWGELTAAGPLRHGGGPNLLFEIGKARIDLVLQIHTACQPEIVLRWHWFF